MQRSLGWTAISGKVGTEAVPALIAALTDAYVDVRRLAADALGNIGPAAAEAVPALIAALTEADVDVRRLAADALGNIGPAAAEAVPALIAARHWAADDALRKIRVPGVHSRS